MSSLDTDIRREQGKTLRAPIIFDALDAEYPDAEIELNWSNAFELLVVVVLSAQSTDVKVNEISPELFRAYPTPQAMAAAEPEDLYGLVGQLNFYRNKSKHLVGLSRAIVTEHDGEVPRTMDELTALPGVARKTANVVLSNAFGINAGVVVDTHIGRLSQRLRFTTETDPVKIEKDLMRLFDSDDWLRIADLLIFHGRRVCSAQRPSCDECVIEPLCHSSQLANMRDKFKKS